MAGAHARRAQHAVEFTGVIEPYLPGKAFVGLQRLAGSTTVVARPALRRTGACALWRGARRAPSARHGSPSAHGSRDRAYASGCSADRFSSSSRRVAGKGWRIVGSVPGGVKRTLRGGPGARRSGCDYKKNNSILFEEKSGCCLLSPRRLLISGRGARGVGVSASARSVEKA